MPDRKHGELYAHPHNPLMLLEHDGTQPWQSWEVAEVFGYIGHQDDPYERSRYYMRLFCHAPEMLAMLERIAEGGIVADGGFSVAQAALEALIARVKGESNE